MGKRKRKKIKDKLKRKAAQTAGRVSDALDDDRPDERRDDRPDMSMPREAPIIEGIKSGKIIHRQTRDLIATAMRRNALPGWYETNENPHKPDAQIAVEVLKQLATITESLAARDPKPEIVHEVVLLAAQTTAWVQGLTYRKDVKPWA